MRRCILFFCGLLLFCECAAQTVSRKLQKAVEVLLADTQMRHALLGFHVIDAKTGATVYSLNGRVGLAPASTQKVVTAVAALDLLGPSFRYETKFGYSGTIKDSVLIGDLEVWGSGDPTLGSWRYASGRPAVIAGQLREALSNAKIRAIQGKVNIPEFSYRFEKATIPDGYIWQDIGNYYGAGHGMINWNENQYDLVLRPGKRAGDPVAIIRTRPRVDIQFRNDLLSGDLRSGDNGYIYLPSADEWSLVSGSVPCCVDSFTISGAYDGRPMLIDFLSDELPWVRPPTRAEVQLSKGSTGAVTGERRSVKPGNDSARKAAKALDVEPPIEGVRITPLFTHHSPSLDSIVYWFLKSSINLYGEALVRTLALEKTQKAEYRKGLNLILDFWKSKGINPGALNILDGSGLSPQNRVTPEALTQVLRYARSRSWFPAFFNGLPLIDGIRMKSGSIGGARAYTGYITRQQAQGASGSTGEYIFAIIVNNFDGSASDITRKMRDVLNVLK